MVRVIERPAVMSLSSRSHTEELRVEGRDVHSLTDHQLNIISIVLIRYNKINTHLEFHRTNFTKVKSHVVAQYLFTDLDTLLLTSVYLLNICNIYLVQPFIKHHINIYEFIWYAYL